MSGFYLKFVKNYAKIAQPMTRCLKKPTIHNNNPCYIVSFQKLKDIITNAPIVWYPNLEKTFKISTDASNFAIGSVLTQDWHPIAFASLINREGIVSDLKSNSILICVSVAMPVVNFLKNNFLHHF